MADRQCYYDGKKFSEGSIICCNDKEMHCVNGKWIKTGDRCPDKKTATTEDKKGK